VAKPISFLTAMMSDGTFCWLIVGVGDLIVIRLEDVYEQLFKIIMEIVILYVFVIVTSQWVCSCFLSRSLRHFLRLHQFNLLLVW